MTKEEFIASYCEGSKMEWSELGKLLTTEPCSCGEPGCNGWQMVSMIARQAGSGVETPAAGAAQSPGREPVMSHD